MRGRTRCTRGSPCLLDLYEMGRDRATFVIRNWMKDGIRGSGACGNGGVGKKGVGRQEEQHIPDLLFHPAQMIL